MRRRLSGPGKEVELLFNQVKKLGWQERESLLQKLQKGKPKAPKDEGSAGTPTTSALFAVFMVSCVPMIGFGFVDNFLMIIAGEYLEAEFGGRFHLSTLAAAGLGNLFSDGKLVLLSRS
jgi:chitinase